MQRLLGTFTLVIALAALVTACSPTAGGDPTEEVPTEEPTTDAGSDFSMLQNTSWVLVEMMNEAPVAGTQITLSFGEAEINGQACNSYFGSFTTAPKPADQEWADGLITFSGIGSTDMACMEPEGAMEQESTYFNILSQMSGYRIESDGRLVLEHPTMNPCCLIFEPQPSLTPDTGDPLSGLSATLVDLNGVALEGSTPITISFENGQASGSAGCNTFSSTYTLSGEGNIGFSPVITTRMACDGDGVMEREASFTALLESMTHYEGIAADALNLTNDNGEYLNFALNMEASVSSPVSLVGTEWVLWSLNGASPLEGSEITIAFQDAERLAGFGGCNNYGASYHIGENNLITIDSAERTEMFCEGTGDQENVYFDTLTKITSFEVEGDQLSMYGEAETLIWTLKPRADMNPADLIGSKWMLMEIDGVALGEGFLVPTLNFIEDGKVEGAGGCRPYEATYVAEGDKLTFTSLAMLADTCESGDDLEFEQNFTTLLSTSTNYVIDGDILTIHSNGGHVMRFERTE